MLRRRVHEVFRLFNLLPGIFTFSADTVVSALLIGCIILDLRRRSLTVSYVRLLLAILSTLVSGWLHLLIIIVTLGLGSNNQDSTVTLLCCATGRKLGSTITAPVSVLTAFVAFIIYKAFGRNPGSLLKCLPFISLVWLGLLITLSEASVFQSVLRLPVGTWSAIDQFLIELVLALTQLLLVCCLVDFIGLILKSNSRQRP